MEKWSHRQSACVLALKDKSGAPIKGREVTADMTAHEFLFGSGAFILSPMLDPATPRAERERLERVWEAWQELFNFGTLPFYQGRYEPVRGKPDEERTLRAADLLFLKGCQVKGHPLCWHTVAAPWLMGLSPEEVLDNQLSRIRRELGAFKRAIKFWDVINEAVIMPEFVNGDNAITPMCQKFGRVPLIKKLFDAARESDPDATLLINDFNLSERYRQLIEDCLKAGVPIDVIGLQTHQHQGAMGLEKLHAVVERFTPLGLPLHFTENTFVSGHLMPPEIVDLNDYKVDSWPSTPEGEDRQARDLIEMTDFLFDSPSVMAMTYWDFEDGKWLNAPSGLLRRDGSRKPSYDALKQRIRRDWHTRVTLRTDENGQCALRGYRGKYRVTADNLSGEMTLDKTSDKVEITLK